LCKDFCGKPLLAWSIEQAKSAKTVSSVWVSSDSDEILDVAKQFGAGIIRRPDEISNDSASSEAAWLHASSVLEKQDISVDVVLGIQATSPIRNTYDFDEALKYFELNHYDSLFSCTELNDFLFWKQDKEGNYYSCNYDYKLRGRRQGRDSQYLENGSFYLFKPEILKKHNNRLGGVIGVYEMDFWKSFQIDDLEEFHFCEILMRHYILEKGNTGF